MNKFIKILSVAFVIIGLVVFVFFLCKSSIDGYSIFTSSKTDYTVTGQFGDFVGGVIGTIFALAGTFLIFLTFQEQAKVNKRTAFESVFFEMIRLHKENVTELRCSRYVPSEKMTEKYENRQVMRIIFDDVVNCYREVSKFSNSKEPIDYINSNYLVQLNDIITKNKITASPIDLARIDIAYCMVFFGVGVEGETILRELLKKKYNPEYYFKLIYFIKMKPKKSNLERFSKWKYLRGLELEKLHQVIDELYKNKSHPEKTDKISSLAAGFKMHASYEKYYGGHQFRLGHYFRHLYQSYKYLDNATFLEENKQYSYGKMLRAQLSTYEQALLFMNSISSIGMKWEYLPEPTDNQKNCSKLITKYNLIKNLSGNHIFGIHYKNYYPDVSYETDEYTS
ncbi:TPA: putative phage abortive infection protein [Klebsiella pneumoniae]|nr:putative phage abortive infection protein [Klebsiella pneumoniae]